MFQLLSVFVITFTGDQTHDQFHRTELEQLHSEKGKVTLCFIREGVPNLMDE